MYSYSDPQWISYQNESELISTSIEIDLYSVDESTNSQTHIDNIQFTDQCEAITFNLPNNDHGINISDNILKTNTTYIIPQCIYFEWETQTWSDDGCWLLDYNINETICACNHLNR